MSNSRQAEALALLRQAMSLLETPEPAPEPAPQPVPEPVPEPGPQPAPAPAPVAPAILSVEIVGGAEVQPGGKARFRVRTQGMAEVKTVMVLPQSAGWKWRAEPADNTMATHPTSGEVAVEHTVGQDGEFLKAIHTTDTSIAKDSPPVKVAAPAVVPQPAPSEDAAFAAAWLRGLTMGVNIERNQVVDNGWVDDGFLTEIKGQGVTHLRLYAASGGQFPLIGADALAGRHFAAVERAVAKGFKVHWDILDVVGENQLGEDVMAHVERTAQAIAARNWDPAKVVVGAVNEYAAGTNKGFEAKRERMMGILRKHLPKHVLVNNGCNWGDPWKLIDPSFKVMPDRRMIYQWHLYHHDAGNVAVCEDIQKHVGGWAAEKGATVYCGEWGIGPPDNSNGAAQNYKAFPSHIDAAARGMGQMRSAMWTITGGSWWRLNRDGSARLRPEVADAFRKADAHIRAQPWFNA